MFISRSSLFYSTSARYECDTSETRATPVRYESDTSATRITQVRHELYKSDFDNDVSKNIFSHPYISYVVNGRLEEEKQFRSKNYLSEMPLSHANIESVPPKLNFVIGKAISK